jgi:hypothetical protein
MEAEFAALQHNGTWHLVPPRLGVNIIDCKWVFSTLLVLLTYVVLTRLSMDSNKHLVPGMLD